MANFKGKFLCAVFVGVSYLSIYSQSIALMDTLRDSFHKAPRLLLRLDTRNSFITGKPASIRGVQVGCSYGDHVQIGLGYHFLTKDFSRFETDTSRLTFRYVAPFFEYSFIHLKNWQVSIPVRLGFGFSKVSFLEDAGSLKFALLYEPAMTVEYRLFRYIGVGIGVAYRLMLVNHLIEDYQFNSPVYLLKFRILFGKLYKEKVLPMFE